MHMHMHMHIHDMPAGDDDRLPTVERARETEAARFSTTRAQSSIGTTRPPPRRKGGVCKRERSAAQRSAAACDESCSGAACSG